jgi:prolyl-tRNA synthetase
MFTLLVQDITSSYRDFPLLLLQVQTRFRDEARPRGGLLRSREFLIKDAYSFALTDDELRAVVVGRRLTEGYAEVRDRRTGERRDVPLTDVPRVIAPMVG